MKVLDKKYRLEIHYTNGLPIGKGFLAYNNVTPCSSEKEGHEIIAEFEEELKERSLHAKNATFRIWFAKMIDIEKEKEESYEMKLARTMKLYYTKKEDRKEEKPNYKIIYEKKIIL